MDGSLETSIGQTITVGSAGYASPLTIGILGTVATDSAETRTIYLPSGTSLTNQGVVLSTADPANPLSGTGVYLAGNGYVDNSGLISGGAGLAGPNSARVFGNYPGGLGIYARGPSEVVNAGTVLGGAGQSAGANGGAYGHAGIVLGDGGSVTNTGLAGGGGGGAGYGGTPGGAGGAGMMLYFGGTLSNTGNVAGGVGGNAGTAPLIGNGGAGGYGLVLFIGDDLSNTGTISGGAGGTGYYGGNGGMGVFADAAALTNAGTIYGGAGASGQAVNGGNGGIGLSLYGTMVNTGLIAGGAGGYGLFGGNGGTGAVLYNSVLYNAGTIAGGYGGSGPLGPGAAGDAVDFAPNGAPSTLVVEPGASFTGNVVAVAGLDDALVLAGTQAASLPGIGTQFQNFGQISFAQYASWTLEGDVSGATISGFDATDTIILDGLVAASASYAAGYGLVLNEGAATLSLVEPYPVSTADFTLAALGGDTEITTDVPCFCAGTRIATPNGERLVEALAVGDFVTTLHRGPVPIIWMGERRYDGRFAAGNHLVAPVRVRAGALARGVPKRDLLVSPGHALFHAGLLVPAWRLINGTGIVQEACPALVHYLHIELAQHEIIFADGAPTESFYDDDCRAQFQNFASFDLLNLPKGGLVLPRTESGFALAGLQARPAPGGTREFGLLRGFVDQLGPAHCTGWAQDTVTPEVPVSLDICAGDRRVARVLANFYRADLREAGLGSGCHGFEAALPSGVTGPLEIRRSQDGVALALTEAALARAA